MNNKAKIYSLYFAIADVIALVCSIVNNDEGYKGKIDSEKLFIEFFSEARFKYFHLKRKEESKSSLSRIQAKGELGRIEVSIENYLGKLDSDNLDLVYPLWTTFHFALNFYFLIREDQSNLIHELESRLALEYQKYLSLSASNSALWTNIDQRIKSKLGNF